MSVLIHMGEEIRDVEVEPSDDGELIRIKHGEHTIRMAPEAARAMAWVIIGMTGRVE